MTLTFVLDVFANLVRRGIVQALLQHFLLDIRPGHLYCAVNKKDSRHVSCYAYLIQLVYRRRNGSNLV